MRKELIQEPINGNLQVCSTMPVDLVKWIETQIDPLFKSMDSRSRVICSLVLERAIELGYSPPDDRRE